MFSSLSFFTSFAGKWKAEFFGKDESTIKKIRIERKETGRLRELSGGVVHGAMAGRGRSKSTLGFHHEPAGGKEKGLPDKGEKGERSFWKEQVLGAGVRAASTANIGRYVCACAAPVFPPVFRARARPLSAHYIPSSFDHDF